MTAFGAGAVVPVRAGGTAVDYPVMVGAGLLAELPELVARYAPAHRYVVVSDSNVAPLHGGRVAEALGADLLVMPAGEENKTRAEWERLTDRLLELGHGRDSVVVAVGGGVVGDLAGFVAATFMRGVPVVQVPTSLVAMVDSSVGGKTGIDTEAGKNLVGAFHPPRLVVADPDTIDTLPRAERSQGLAEAVKHGAILDAEYLAQLQSGARDLLEARPQALAVAVLRSVELKADVVSRDEHEGGLRQILNFGHTLGHALEASFEYRLPHGSAVALGMLLEARLGERLGISDPGTAEHLVRAVGRMELPTSLPPETDLERVVNFLAADKKARGGRARYVLLERPGRVSAPDGWSRHVDESEVRAALEEAAGGPFQTSRG